MFSRLTTLSLFVALMGLGGVPATNGFISKFVLFNSAIGSGLAWLAIVGVLNSALSMYYYLKTIIALYGKPGEETPKVHEAPLLIVRFTAQLDRGSRCCAGKGGGSAPRVQLHRVAQVGEELGLSRDHPVPVRDQRGPHRVAHKRQSGGPQSVGGHHGITSCPVLRVWCRPPSAAAAHDQRQYLAPFLDGQGAHHPLSVDEERRSAPYRELPRRLIVQRRT